MVKNTGGNKSKKLARKTVGGGGGGGGNDVRRVKDVCEMYAAVTKIYSSKRCDIIGTDGINRPCTIRGKFLGRKRSGDGTIAVGAWVMIGFYDWEVRGDGSKNCDLLEVYTAMEKEKLKQIENHTLLGPILNVGELAGAENEFTFSNFKQEEEEESSSSSEEEDKPVPASALPALAPVLPVKKETIQDQMDWLTIPERDI